MNPTLVSPLVIRKKNCNCALVVAAKYQKHISNSLLDRIDIHIEVPHVNNVSLSMAHPILLQCGHARWGDTTILQVAGRRSEFDAGIEESDESVGASLSVHRKVSMYDADFARSEEIQSEHLAEALQCRPKIMMA